jgi:hypothetical protein
MSNPASGDTLPKQNSYRETVTFERQNAVCREDQRSPTTAWPYFKSPRQSQNAEASVHTHPKKDGKDASTCIDSEVCPAVGIS